MSEVISQPWPWYLSGPMIGLVMFLLLWSGEKFGVSSSLRTLCSIGGVGKRIEFFNFNWKRDYWLLLFVFGAVVGGFIAHYYFNSGLPLDLSEHTIADLRQLGIGFNGGLAPEEIFSWNCLLTIKGVSILIGGGFLVGFGARWAGGCTSGHAISGLSNLQVPSLIAVIGFFIGGLIMTHFIFPIIF